MKFPRMFVWLLASIALLATVFLLHPQLVSVTIYKLSFVSAGGVGGYWLDRSLFPYARPDRFYCVDDDDPDTEGDAMFSTTCFVQNDLLFVAAQLRRTLLVIGGMIALALGA